jgi:UDP-glucuronate 4-epimerase
MVHGGDLIWPLIFLQKKILNGGETIDINNNGDMQRDFTHVDDIVEGVIFIAELVVWFKNFYKI